MILTTPGSQIPEGAIRISGAKNAATRMLAAAALSPNPVRLTNFPTRLRDAEHKIRYLRDCGVGVTVDHEGDLVEITARDYNSAALQDFDYPIRTTYLLVAGQISRGVVARVPYPGGCRIGERKHDLHVMVWEKFGCRVAEKANCIEVTPEHFRACEIDFPISTVGGTENALLCATLAPGTSRIRNAYITPEIDNLLDLLRRMGAVITRFGTSGLEVEGVARLSSASCPVKPDRIEALTWMAFAAVSGGSILLSDVPLEDMVIPLVHLRSMSIDYLASTRSLHILPHCIPADGVQPFEVACGSYPGVVSDMQPFFVLLALAAHGKSLIIDYRYPGRTAYLQELSRLAPGAIEWSDGRVRVDGPAKLTGAEVSSTDLRGSMALLLAALIARGPSKITGVETVLRGYNRLEQKLKHLGVDFAIH